MPIFDITFRIPASIAFLKFLHASCTETAEPGLDSIMDRIVSNAR